MKRAIIVYLTTFGPATVQEIADHLMMHWMKVRDLLNSMPEVTRVGNKYTT